MKEKDKGVKAPREELENKWRNWRNAKKTQAEGWKMCNKRWKEILQEGFGTSGDAFEMNGRLS